jgi:hypothetical protein
LLKRQTSCRQFVFGAAIGTFEYCHHFTKRR